MRALATAATLVFAAGTALAGAKANAPVTVDPVNRVATGSLGSARNSTDSQQYIGCAVFSGPGVTSVFCHARTAAGVVAQCGTDTPEIVAAARGIGTDSYVELFWDDRFPVGECVGLNVENNSFYAPKK